VPREILTPAQIHPSPGYSHIAKATGSRLAFVAGQTALDKDFNIVGVGDLEVQTRQVMVNLNHALDELGATWDDVVNATVYTTRPTEFKAIGRAMSEGRGAAEPPPEVIAGVTSLALPELLVEIELVVSLP
jgi:enamine deaminase RidA (YjgF/YER057c/UK114 family)